ncbi:MAG: CinA family protein [Burkholderiaceae bacterium]|nr:CinA family protein [Burkholderiaceae bacterium]
MRLNKLISYLKDNDLVVATAESCTAGLIAGRLADASGAGSSLEVGYVVYSPQAKCSRLGVSKQTIETCGLTSEAVAREMVLGALARSSASVAVADTGLADEPPEGSDIPAGTVCFAWALRDGDAVRVFSETRHFDGSRNAVRRSAADYALGRIPHYHRCADAPDN